MTPVTVQLPAAVVTAQAFTPLRLRDSSSVHTPPIPVMTVCFIDKQSGTTNDRNIKAREGPGVTIGPDG
jgi:hypothetical protein